MCAQLTEYVSKFGRKKIFCFWQNTIKCIFIGLYPFIRYAGVWRVYLAIILNFIDTAHKCTSWVLLLALSARGANRMSLRHLYILTRIEQRSPNQNIHYRLTMSPLISFGGLHWCYMQIAVYVYTIRICTLSRIFFFLKKRACRAPFLHCVQLVHVTRGA